MRSLTPGWPVVALFTSVIVGMVANAAIPAQAQDAVHDTSAIVGLIKSTWEKPDQPISVAPVVLAGTYAIASWVQGERGGRALLKRADGKAWTVVLCSGDGIKTADGMEAAGVPKEAAIVMARELASGEAQLPESQRVLLSTFDGSGDGEAKGHHSPHDNHLTH